MFEEPFGTDCAALAVEAARNPSGALQVRGALCTAGCLIAFGGTDGHAEADTIMEAARLADGRLLVCWSSRELRLWKRLLCSAGSGEADSECVFLETLARRVLPDLAKWADPEDLAGALELPAADPERPVSMARFMHDSFRALLDLLPPELRSSLHALNKWLEAAHTRVDFGHFAFGREWLSRLPVSSGVYVMRASDGRVIYVGKAANVRRRVCSYFTPAALHSAKNKTLHEQIYSVDVVHTETEIEALLTEMRLIRRYRPIVNIQSEVHETREGFGRRRNLVLLVPDRDGARAALYLLRQGSFAGRIQVRLGRPAPARLARRIRQLYYSTNVASARERLWERELVFRWLARNRGKLNLVDIDDAGSCDEALRQISDYLLDPERLSVKVCRR